MHSQVIYHRRYSWGQPEHWFPLNIDEVAAKGKTKHVLLSVVIVIGGSDTVAINIKLPAVIRSNVEVMVEVV